MIRYFSALILSALIWAPKKFLLFFDRWVMSVEHKRWCRITMPLIRKVFPILSVKDFVEVQPMSEPSGQVFYFDFKRSAPTKDKIIRDGEIIIDQQYYDNYRKQTLPQIYP
jgi:hypothetical protein